MCLISVIRHSPDERPDPPRSTSVVQKSIEKCEVVHTEEKSFSSDCGTGSGIDGVPPRQWRTHIEEVARKWVFAGPPRRTVTRNRKPIASRTLKTVVKLVFLDRLRRRDECSASQPRFLRKVRDIVQPGDGANGVTNFGDIRLLERSIYAASSGLKRARIVLLAAAGRSTRSIAKEVGVQPRIVSLWRHRFADLGLEGLQDKPRPGKQPIYTKSTDKRILKLLDKPPPVGFARWTGPLLAGAMGDVDVQYVWRFLRTRL